jgi:hypothetical protein
LDGLFSIGPPMGSELQMDFATFDGYREKKEDLVKLIEQGPKANGFVPVMIELPLHFLHAGIRYYYEYRAHPVEVEIYAFLAGRNYPENHASDYRDLVIIDPILTEKLGVKKAQLGLTLDEESEDYSYSIEVASIREAVDRIFDVADALLSVVQRGIIHQDIDELLSQRESEFLEFKPTLICDPQADEVSKRVEHTTAKELCAFLNAKGGTLVVGLDDKRNVLGVRRELTLLHQDGKSDKDIFDQRLTALVASHLGAEKRTHIHLDWEQSHDNDLAVITMSPGDSETYVKYEGRNEFYLRLGNTSQLLDVKAAADYIRKRWPNWHKDGFDLDLPVASTGVLDVPALAFTTRQNEAISELGWRILDAAKDSSGTVIATMEIGRAIGEDNALVYQECVILRDYGYVRFTDDSHGMALLKITGHGLQALRNRPRFT